jgi:phosphoribosylformimino-5-aminoimidazole carboxamide ribotide isomerase
MASVLLQNDLELVRVAGHGRVNITVGSALDIFGGKLPYSVVVQWHREQTRRAFTGYVF